MPRLRLWLTITFVESFAAVLVQRGIYFYTEETLEFTARQNLMLATAVGVVYVIAALLSHRLAKGLGERRLMQCLMLTQIACFVAMLLQPFGVVLVIGSMAFSVALGLKWPLIESYISAGRTPAQQAKAIGSFNLTWSLAIPSSVIAAGPLLQWFDGADGLLMLGLIASTATLVLLMGVMARPTHLAHDHPDRITLANTQQLRALLASSRWSMLCSYSLIFLLNPLYPYIFKDLGYTVIAATALAAGVDVVRFLTFAMLQRFEGWHGRRVFLVLTVLSLPIGFSMVRFGDHVAWVLGGEVIFGLATGLSYYSALYYGMVVSNASVDAGGHHEAMIGSGFVIGPGAGLVSNVVGAKLGSVAVGSLLGVGPLIVLTGFGGLWPLRKVGRHVRLKLD